MDTGFDGAQGNTQYATGFLIGKLLSLLEDKGQPVFLGKSIHGPLEPLQLFRLVQNFLRGRTHIGQDIGPIVPLDPMHDVVKENTALSLTTSHLIDRQVGGDPVEPGLKLILTLIAVVVAVHPDEGLLGQIHRRVEVVDQPVQVIHQTVLIPAHQDLKGILVAFEIGGNQLVIPNP